MSRADKIKPKWWIKSISITHYPFSFTIIVCMISMPLRKSSSYWAIDHIGEVSINLHYLIMFMFLILIQDNKRAYKSIWQFSLPDTRVWAGWQLHEIKRKSVLDGHVFVTWSFICFQYLSNICNIVSHNIKLFERICMLWMVDCWTLADPRKQIFGRHVCLHKRNM